MEILNEDFYDFGEEQTAPVQNQIQVFENKSFGKLRSILIDNEPWFVGKDPAKLLGYKDTSDALKKHVDIEDKMGRQITDSLGRPQKTIVINESGLYSLILSSKLPTAKKFKHWVTSEVLPQIRETGGYVNNEDLFINTYLPYADENTKLVFRNTLGMVRKQNEIIAVQKSTINNQGKQIEHKDDVIVGLVDQITLAEKRQILNRVVRYKGANYRERWGELYHQFEMKYHIESINSKLKKYNATHKPKLRGKLDYVDKVMNKIPELYEIACKLYENDVKELANNLYSLN
jgi:prophage antirepressor-like protein